MKVVVQLGPNDYRWFRRHVLFRIHGFGRIFLIGYVVISVLHQLNEPATSSTSYRIADQIALRQFLLFCGSSCPSWQTGYLVASSVR